MIAFDRARRRIGQITSSVAWVSADRVEADIAPQFEPDLVADAIEHGGLHAGLDEGVGKPLYVLGGLAGGLA
jgi:hypothetical protein